MCNGKTTVFFAHPLRPFKQIRVIEPVADIHTFILNRGSRRRICRFSRLLFLIGMPARSDQKCRDKTKDTKSYFISGTHKVGGFIDIDRQKSESRESFTGSGPISVFTTTIME
jgi:hypothetical protein